MCNASHNYNLNPALPLDNGLEICLINVDAAPKFRIKAHFGLRAAHSFAADAVVRPVLGSCGNRGLVDARPWKGKAWAEDREDRSRGGTYDE
jgi:hypothetical protein